MMRFAITPGLAVFLLAWSIPLLHAQSPAAAAVEPWDSLAPATVVQAGTVVRVTERASGARTTGALMRADSVLLLQPFGGVAPWQARWPAIERVELRQVRHTAAHAARRGALTGAAVGATLTAMLYVVASSADGGEPCGDCLVDARGVVAVLAVPLVGLSTGIGAVVGHSSRGRNSRDGWVDVPLPLRTPLQPQAERPAASPLDARSPR
jgi:hypothetical protein